MGGGRAAWARAKGVRYPITITQMSYQFVNSTICSLYSFWDNNESIQRKMQYRKQSRKLRQYFEYNQMIMSGYMYTCIHVLIYLFLK